LPFFDLKTIFSANSFSQGREGERGKGKGGISGRRWGFDTLIPAAYINQLFDYIDIGESGIDEVLF
jgi:hypothetical protein